MRNIVDGVRDAVLASAGAGGGSMVAASAGEALAAPGWLIALSQTAIVVVFTVYAVNRKMARLHKAVNQTIGHLETLEGKFDALSCVKKPLALCDDLAEGE